MFGAKEDFEKDMAALKAANPGPLKPLSYRLEQRGNGLFRMTVRVPNENYEEELKDYYKKINEKI